MTNTTHHITIVSPNLQDNNNNNIQEIITEINAELKLVANFTELFSLLIDPQFNTNLICINVESLYEHGNIAAWNNISAVVTLLKSSPKIQISDNHTRDKVFIAVCANRHSSISHIKDFLSLNRSCIGVFPKGDIFTKEDQKLAAIVLLNGSKYIPDFFKNKFKPRKKQILKDPTKLTPRQKQIFDLVVSRGSSNKAIARTLNISESTVKLHMTAILKKNSVRNRTQLAVFSKKS
jgi:DNA-binding NarL/FixJ family response regulator